MEKLTLAVLAAGMGSRFGGMKQTETIDGAGHTLLDYSLHDAVLAGFGRAVFIIRKEMKDDFLSLVTSRRWYKKIKTDLAFQELKDIPSEFNVPENRKKPWGTAHAIACLNGLVDSPFAVINADDFYGREALFKVADHLSTGENCMVAYKLKNTLSKHGAVSRGVCIANDGYLAEITERWGIKLENGVICDGEGKIMTPEANVSMNLWGFIPDIVGESRKRFYTFLKKNLINAPETCEFYIPNLVEELIAERKTAIKVIETQAEWYGITYKKDKSEVSLALEDMVNNGVYPACL